MKPLKKFQLKTGHLREFIVGIMSWRGRETPEAIPLESIERLLRFRSQ